MHEPPNELTWEMKRQRINFPAFSALLMLLAYLFRERLCRCLAALLRWAQGFPIDEDVIPLPPPSRGNGVQPLVAGEELLPAILNLIQGAGMTVRYQVMLFRPDEAGKKVAAALVAAAVRGVQVQLSFDVRQTVVGPPYRPYTKAEQQSNAVAMAALLEDFGRAGVFVLRNPGATGIGQGTLSPPARRRQRGLQRVTCTGLNHIDHRKMLIVDGERAIVGGANVGNEYLYAFPADLGARMDQEAEIRRREGLPEAWEKWIDVAAFVRGPAASELAREFDLGWEILGGEVLQTSGAPSPAGDVMVQPLSQRPGDEQIAARTLQLIRAASDSIYVASPYVSFLPGLRELMRAARRGVHVVFLFPGDLNDVAISRRIFRSFTHDLLRAGVRVFENNLRMIHAKVMIVDGRWTSIGSFNFNYRSFRHDLEQNLIIDDRAFSEHVAQRLFARLVGSSTRLAHPYRRRLSLWDRIAMPFT
jgi:cardiolipin synthase